MSTVLEKPVLLDETGQDIVYKLDEIKTAIGSTGEFIPVMIKVTTPPTKTTYGAGETLDLTGMVVTLYASNGLTFDVTGDCTFSPANGATLTSQDTSVAISYTWYETQTTFTSTQNLTMTELTSISVTTPPTKTSYIEGEALDLTGIVITANFDNNSSKIVTNECTFSPANGSTLSSTDTEVVASYSFAGVTKTATQSLEIIPLIYGAEWDGTASPIWTRTDLAADFTDPIPYYAGMSETPSSPFDTIYPWSDIEVVNDSNAGKLVKIPKFYFKWTRNGSSMKLQISGQARDGFYTSPAHADRGDGVGERDYVYVGRYKCSSTDYKSASGITPMTNKTRATYRSAIHGLGAEIWQQDFAMFWTIRMLYLVEFANWNSQATIGYGCGESSSGTTVYNMGYTDSMPYHTGTYQSSRTTYGGTQYRYIEGLWDNCNEYYDGIYFSDTDIFVINNPTNFSDTTGGENVGTRATGTSKVVSEWTAPDAEGYEYALYPSNTADPSGYTVYSCDKMDYRDTGVVFYSGGINSYQQSMGLFLIDGFDKADSTGSTRGARLMMLPGN